MIDLIHALEARYYANMVIIGAGIVPGELDSIEVNELRIRRKELRFIIDLLKLNGITGEVSELP